MRSKLSSSDWASVLQMANAGQTSAEIEDALRRRGLEIHQSNIRRYVAKHKTEVVQRESEQDELNRTARAFLAEHGSLPEVPKRIKTTRIEEMGFDTPQPAIALFSDLHYGSRIDSRVTGGLAEYNIDIARERLARWRNGLLRFHQADSLLIDIPALHLFALGDDLEGHGAMFPTQALQMEESVLFQYMGFVEDVTGVLLSLLERYPKIHVYKVFGNHGRIADTSKGMYPPDNLEIMAWEHIADRVKAKTGGEWSTSRTGIHSLTGGKIDFHISRSFFIMAEIEGQLVYARHGHKIGGLNRTYCMDPNTPVLTRDLRWVAAGELKVGDHILGFDEERGSYGEDVRSRRSYQDAEVTAAGIKELPLYEITLSTGEVFKASGEHRWLAVGKADRHIRWVRTDEMAAQLNGEKLERGGRRAESFHIPRYIDTWQDSSDREDGLLAAAFDANGSIDIPDGSGVPTIRFEHTDEATIGPVRTALRNKGYAFKERTVKYGLDTPITQIELRGGFAEVVRFLGQQRPARLLQGWMEHDVSTRNTRRLYYAEVESVRFIGLGPVAAISSSSQTYLAAGYPVHNTGALDNKLRMNSIVSDSRLINFMFKAHLHEAQELEGEIGGQVVQNGCFVGPSLLSVEMQRAAASLPSQEMYLIHPKYGLTHHHRIRLATPAEIRGGEAVVAGEDTTEVLRVAA